MQKRTLDKLGCKVGKDELVVRLNFTNFVNYSWQCFQVSQLVVLLENKYLNEIGQNKCFTFGANNILIKLSLPNYPTGLSNFVSLLLVCSSFGTFNYFNSLTLLCKEKVPQQQILSIIKQVIYFKLIICQKKLKLFC